MSMVVHQPWIKINLYPEKNNRDEHTYFRSIGKNRTGAG